MRIIRNRGGEGRTAELKAINVIFESLSGLASVESMKAVLVAVNSLAENEINKRSSEAVEERKYHVTDSEMVGALASRAGNKVEILFERIEADSEMDARRRLVKVLMYVYGVVFGRERYLEIEGVITPCMKRFGLVGSNYHGAFAKWLLKNPELFEMERVDGGTRIRLTGRGFEEARRDATEVYENAEGKYRKEFRRRER